MKADQTIGCQVKSCRFNDQQSYCNLKEIEVTPAANAGSGNPEDESLCASYRTK